MNRRTKQQIEIKSDKKQIIKQKTMTHKKKHNETIPDMDYSFQRVSFLYDETTDY